MTTWADRLRLARLLVAPPPPEAHVGSRSAWRLGWAARLAGIPRSECPHQVERHIVAWDDGYEACGVAMGKPPA